MDNLESCNAIRMTSIAHAEINAVNNIPAENQQKKGMTLYTTVEPCPMCLGAIVMSRIRKIIIGSADPYAGSTELLQKGEYLKNKGVKVKFESGKIEELFFMLHYLSIRRYLLNRPDHPVFNRLRKRYSTYMNKIESIIEPSSSIEEYERINKNQIMNILKD